ncbi:enoyl-CoA hydratase/isomerase family protein [Marinobacterium maritimum]|uniref:Enoyl-CoA hydratase/isomerase family protein n=1 Tax=Marinobacterium maritimum TaxID=500162 RepID=A0ABP3T9W8_9GAMM
MYDCIQLVCDQGIATLTIDRPAELNAISEAAFGELKQALLGLHDNPDLRVVILKGNGKAFCAGGDIVFFAELIRLPASQRPAAVRRYIGLAHEVVELLAGLKVPLLVVVQGAAAGFGLSLCCLADLLVASDNSRFVPAYIGLGATPDGGLSYNLPRLIGAGRAADLLLNNRGFDAEQAQQWGLVSSRVAAGDLDAEVARLAGQLGAGPGVATANTLMLLRSQRLDALRKVLDAELDSFADCAQSDDFVEGVTAFLERRAPRFLSA